MEKTIESIDKEGERKEFSIFVNSIPHTLNQYGLKRVFQKAGRVNDGYIPLRRTRRNETRFSFARFWRHDNVVSSRLMLNNNIVRGNKIHVSMAQYEKVRERGRHNHAYSRKGIHNNVAHGSRKGWSMNIQLEEGTNETKKSQETQQDTSFMQGKFNAKFAKWLTRSLICTSKEPRNIALYLQH
ncbi:hypothetical protein Cgig2_023873 [Carnegiea gigantea]|uniref:RRM domain-containing protein n=1 Tax=Carnegiea gigantea TaxID=171969 RepID=A0A9Q1JJ46_9CARY|nr:hypothetical protein Cgig2_023873 [Carnegiea gigantea]